MTDYNFWADLLDTFKSSPDWIKALWLTIPPGFLLALVALLMRYRIAGTANGNGAGRRAGLFRTSPNGRRIADRQPPAPSGAGTGAAAARRG